MISINLSDKRSIGIPIENLHEYETYSIFLRSFYKYMENHVNNLYKVPTKLIILDGFRASLYKRCSLSIELGLDFVFNICDWYYANSTDAINVCELFCNKYLTDEVLEYLYLDYHEISRNCSKFSILSFLRKGYDIRRSALSSYYHGSVYRHFCKD